jgi:polysaccharide pyruvyl transferase WcaK-like protein
MLVPHVFGSGEQSESDVVACQKIMQEIDSSLRESVYTLSEDYNQHEMKALIGHCNFFSGSRMHACIAAISQFIPTVGLAYSPKFKGVFNSVGLEDLVFDLREGDIQSLVEGVDKVYQNGKMIRSSLKKKMPLVVRSIYRLFGEDDLILQSCKRNE